MNNQNFSQQPAVDYKQFVNLVRQMSDEKIEEIVKRARSLGISESYISQGLKTINKIKESK